MGHGIFVNDGVEKIFYRNFTIKDVENYESAILDLELRLMRIEQELLFLLLGKIQTAEFSDYNEIMSYYRDSVERLYKYNLLSYQLFSDKVKIYDDSINKYFIKENNNLKEVSKEEYDNYDFKEDL